jgi:apolipoprotein D and lipocalin family protein
MSVAPQKSRVRPRGIIVSPCVALFCVVIAGCSQNVRPIPPVARVDLPRFMGDWYVIASIPTFVEKDSYEAIESYALQSDGHIRTTFRYRNGGFDRPVKTMHPVGAVRPATGNAVWDMQFIWPIQAQYTIAYVDDGYGETIIARDKRDYVWIMARTPSIPRIEYDALVDRVSTLGYATGALRKVPQRGAAR